MRRSNLTESKGDKNTHQKDIDKYNPNEESLSTIEFDISEDEAESEFSIEDECQCLKQCSSPEDQARVAQIIAEAVALAQAMSDEELEIAIKAIHARKGKG